MKRDLADWLNGLGVPDSEPAHTADDFAPELLVAPVENKKLSAAHDEAESLLVSAENNEENQNKNKNVKRKFLTEQDELQNLADALLLEDKNDDIQPELYNNYSAEDLRQLEDYVEQLENLLDEQEGILREEIKNNIEGINKGDDINTSERAESKKNIDTGAQAGNNDDANNNIEKTGNDLDVNKLDINKIDDVNVNNEYLDSLNMVFNGGVSNENNDNKNNKIVVKERSGEFTQKLHNALHNRKILAMEKSELTGQIAAKKRSRKFKAAALCAFLLALAFISACGALFYFKNKELKEVFDNNMNLGGAISKDIDIQDTLSGDIDNNIYNDINSIDINNESIDNDSNDNNVNVNNDNDSIENINEKINDVNINLSSYLNNKNYENMTYEKYLEAGSSALNKKNWDDAILNFYHASQLDSNDIKPRIGLAGAYYGKGMFFDALRVINETRENFPLDSTVDFMRRSLRRAR